MNNYYTCLRNVYSFGLNIPNIKTLINHWNSYSLIIVISLYQFILYTRLNFGII